MIPQLQRLALVFAAAFLGIALVSGYWGEVRRDNLVARPDNPRRVLAERRLGRGTIYDRNGAVLAESTGAPGAFERHYPYPDLAPVLGYLSVLYGAAGIEASADAVLHGDAGHGELSLYWQDTILGAPPPGRDVRLSIDLRLQTVADQALGDRTGAVVVLDAATGEILALASHPTYDPNDLDAQWESLVNDTGAPLVNRATFALYQPGGALWPVILAGGLQGGDADFHGATASGSEGVEIAGQSFDCRVNPRVARITLAEALSFGCPQPIATLGDRLGAEALDRLFRDFRLFEPPPIGIATTASPQPDQAGVGDIPALAAIGQGSLNVTPLHLALVTAALARQGHMPAPLLVLATQTPELAWLPQVPASVPTTVIAPEYADTVKALMADGYSAVALAGAQGQTLAWFTGFAPFDDSRYAVAVLLEDGDAEAAAQIGRELLASALGGISGHGMLRSRMSLSPR